ncbi:MAG TPA: hypothetical protein HA284_00665 [Nanoarchaeota archaeon]|nr:hypothetical protein [Nanoarchaeota archaeon]
MKKNINEKIYHIEYLGGLQELEHCLESLLNQWERGFSSEISEFTEFDKIISNSNERIYYNKRRILYLPNSYEGLKKVIFDGMKKKSELADENFLKKNLQHKIEMEG